MNVLGPRSHPDAKIMLKNDSPHPQTPMELEFWPFTAKKLVFALKIPFPIKKNEKNVIFQFDGSGTHPNNKISIANGFSTPKNLQGD